jgi:hypothetical protein
LEQPHFYLLIESYKEYEEFEYLLNKHLHTINLKINKKLLNGKIHQTYSIKKAYFSNSNSKHITKDWFESFIKYYFPKYLISSMPLKNKQENKFNFFFSKSELLTSHISLTKHYTGEIKRDISSSICIKDEILHLGIESITTDNYIGEKEANILEIIPSKEIKSLLSFYKNVKPIVDLILLLASFAERRRLNWYKCEGSIGLNYIENYNSRRIFHSDQEKILLICRFEFENYLKNCLKNIQIKDIKYISQLIQSYLSGYEFTTNAKIILWYSIVDKILVKKFQEKKNKKELLKKMGIHIDDLVPIKDLVDIRNDLAHGENVKSDRLFKLMKDWQILIERVILKELKWNNLTMTDVAIDGIKPYGL